MATKSKKVNSTVYEELAWPYGKKNYIYFAIALLVIIIGFILLGTGDKTFSPILLVLGYLVLIPYALMVKDTSVESQQNTEDTDSEE